VQALKRLSTPKKQRKTNSYAFTLKSKQTSDLNNKKRSRKRGVIVLTSYFIGTYGLRFIVNGLNHILVTKEGMMSVESSSVNV
jgi:hypothetical protein